MTTTEFSQAFDTQISAYNESTELSALDKGLSFGEYEKSVFLTRAQDELVLSFYSGRNSYNEGFENTEEVRRYLSPLVLTANLVEEQRGSDGYHLFNDSHIFLLPEGLWFITYEALRITKSEEDPCKDKNVVIEVVPTTQDELHKILKNPFRRPNNIRALRLDIAEDRVEIITPLNNIDTYTIRYIKEPSPIILDTLANDIDIKGKSTVSECELHPALHKAILDRAIQLAITSKEILRGTK